MMYQCISNLEKINFFNPEEKKGIMLENLRNIFYRMELSEKETTYFIKCICKFIKKKVD